MIAEQRINHIINVTIELISEILEIKQWIPDIFANVDELLALTKTQDLSKTKPSVVKEFHETLINENFYVNGMDIELNTIEDEESRQSLDDLFDRETEYAGLIKELREIMLKCVHF